MAKNTLKMIVIKKLNVNYAGKTSTEAIKDLNFEVDAGEFLAIVGTTGCGKTTLVNSLAGFISPTSGDIYINGKKVYQPNTECGVIFQHHALFPWKTVWHNIEFGLKVRGIEKRKRDTIVRNLIHQVGLDGFEHSYPEELSGGMEQRVGLARILAIDPLVLLMDEPFGSLDAQTRMMMQELLLDLWDDFHKTVVFITHDIDEAILLADRILILTARPGSLKDEVKVNLPRPRNQTITLTSEFIKIKEEIMRLIKDETVKAMYQNTIKSNLEVRK